MKNCLEIQVEKCLFQLFGDQSWNAVSRDKKSGSGRQANVPTNFNPIWPRQKICSSMTENRLVCASLYREEMSRMLFFEHSYTPFSNVNILALIVCIRPTPYYLSYLVTTWICGKRFTRPYICPLHANFALSQVYFTRLTVKVVSFSPTSHSAM